MDKKTVELINGLYIQIDNLNYTVLQKTINYDKNGNMIPKIIGYGSDLDRALQIAFRWCVRSNLTNGITTLKQAIQTVKQCKEELKETIKNTEVDA